MGRLTETREEKPYPVVGKNTEKSRFRRKVLTKSFEGTKTVGGMRGKRAAFHFEGGLGLTFSFGRG